MDTTMVGIPVAELDEQTRGQFIWRTYFHVAMAIALFALTEVILFQTGVAERIAITMIQNWLLVLGGFMLVGWLASRTAGTVQSLPAQYLALVGYVIVEAIIFVPLLYVAEYKAPGVIQSAAVVTLLGCVGLMGVAHITRKDFSFLRGLLMWGGVLALVAIVAAVIFGMQLGTWFSVLMIGFAGAAVLYDTSNILHHYPQERYVAASMQLFASIALMFWYVLRLMSSSRN
ncbi:MAG TPA: Bax inhibitor-1 family protein [Steroidobacteraceae bacterium]|nr:Bax inhibitor-1 family protein [Steroidobacteraceae bacterium]